MVGSEEPEKDSPDKGFETGPAIESDDPPPSKDFSIGPLEVDVAPLAENSGREESDATLPQGPEEDDSSEGFGTGTETADDSPGEGFETGQDVKAPSQGVHDPFSVEGFEIERQS